MRRQAHPLTLNLWIAILLVCGTACTNSTRNEIQLGTKPFQFDSNEVIELSLVKSDAEQGDQWQAKLRKEGAQWNISSDHQILDSLADDTFLFHLIDSMKSIQLTSLAPQGTLESFALDPPRFGVQWKTGSKAYEFWVGSSLRDGTGYYFTIDKTHVFVANGPALHILDLIKSFQSLRKKTWTNLTIDDVDEITLKQRRKAVLYAQREGNHWTDRKHHVIKKDIDSFLNHALGAQSERMIDDPKQAASLRKLIHSSLLYEIHLSDRFGKTTSLFLSLQNGILFGINSSRPGVFVLDSKLLQTFRQACVPSSRAAIL